jgi:hypothetical protein
MMMPLIFIIKIFPYTTSTKFPFTPKEQIIDSQKSFKYQALCGDGKNFAIKMKGWFRVSVWTLMHMEIKLSAKDGASEVFSILIKKKIIY